jgi:hypothetical protein
MRSYDIEITKREVLASVSIIAILLLIGVLISSKISEHQMDKNEIYNKAVKIKESDIFEYGMRTNVGNAFVNGDLKAVDTVTYPEIDGVYMYVEKVKERYTMHTRTVIYTTGSGKNRTMHTRTEHYWTWDRVGSEDKTCKELIFCGVTFPSGKVNIPSPEHVETIKESSHVRYKYYGTPTKFKGTIFAKLKDGTIPDNTNFYKDMNIDETYESLKYGNGWIIFFWIVWIAFIIACVFGFYYLDNNWLE